MADESAPLGSIKPREPDDHDVTGTGTPRSADDGLPEQGASATAGSDPAVVVGGTTSSQPAHSDEVPINRSGSGGSGGPVESEDSVEGSSGQSMSELLGGHDEDESVAR